MAKTHKMEIRVRYADTDHFGVVYYARYLDWFEAGRTEILRDNKITYSELEKQGMVAPVVEVKVNYKKPPKYDDLITLETSIEKIGNSSIKFNYKVLSKNNEVLTEAYTVNVFVDKEMKPIRIPDDVREALK